MVSHSVLIFINHQLKMNIKSGIHTGFWSYHEVWRWLYKQFINISTWFFTFQ